MRILKFVKYILTHIKTTHIKNVIELHLLNNNHIFNVSKRLNTKINRTM